MQASSAEASGAQSANSSSSNLAPTGSGSAEGDGNDRSSNGITEQTLMAALDHVESAVFLVGGTGAVRFANEPARRLIEEANVVRRENGMLRTVAIETDRTLIDIIAVATGGDTSIGVRGAEVLLTGSQGDGWFAHILPLSTGQSQRTGQARHAIAAVFVRKITPNTPPPLATIATRYKLLPSEVRVLAAVAKVQGVKALADLLGVSQATVKTHLHNLFRKTGTKRQSELLKLVAGI